MEWIAKLKYLAPRDPGPFVIRRLTKAEPGTRCATCTECRCRSPTSRWSRRWAASNLFSAAVELLEVANKVAGQVMAPVGQALRQFRTAWRDAARGRGSPAARQACSLARCGPATACGEGVGRVVGIFELGQENKLDYTASLGHVEGGPGHLLYHAGRRSGPKEASCCWTISSCPDFYLWSAPPDAELAALADRARCRSRGVVGAGETMLNDRARGRCTTVSALSG